MGVFDDLKDSMTGNDSNSKSKKSRGGLSDGSDSGGFDFDSGNPDFGSDNNLGDGLGKGLQGNNTPQGNSNPAANNSRRGNNREQQGGQKRPQDPSSRMNGGNQRRPGEQGSTGQRDQSSVNQGRHGRGGQSPIEKNQSINSGRNQASRNQNRNNRNASVNKSAQGQNQGNTPNGQAGRPEPGSDQPQLSQSTRKKMENAGMTGNSSNVAESQDEFQELKSQNEQIIELLKRINQRL